MNGYEIDGRLPAKVIVYGDIGDAIVFKSQQALDTSELNKIPFYLAPIN